jgi:hypothetical protein
MELLPLKPSVSTSRFPGPLHLRGKKVNVGEITVLVKFILLIKFTHFATTLFRC